MIDNQSPNDTIWNDPEYFKRLKEEAEKEMTMTIYEKGIDYDSYFKIQ